MDALSTYFKEIYQFLEYGEYSNFTKRLIDITLDTEDVLFYERTLDFLSLFDEEQSESILKERSGQLLIDLESFLRAKKIEERKQLIEVDRLVKSYYHSSFTLGPISFGIRVGEVIGLVGENGNGKTTLLRSLCGELAPTEGTISYHFDYKDRYDLRTKLVYIPQRTTSWNGSLLSNLMFTASSYGIKGKENVLLVDLVIARMGLNKYRDLNWSNLSSGYKMRFELARMLLRKPQLLLIDEPLANLDIVAQQVVLDDFRNIAKSPFRPLGLVLSSQQLYEVEKTSDLVIFLKEGKPNEFLLKNDDENTQEKVDKLVVEFECDCEQDVLRVLLTGLGLEKLQLKGGTYMAVFPGETSSAQFLQTLLKKEISLNYFRDISHSTSRFFLI